MDFNDIRKTVRGELAGAGDNATLMEWLAEYESALADAEYAAAQRLEAMARDHKRIQRFADIAVRFETALRRVLAISADRQRFVARGPLGWAEAERIARAALEE